MTPDPTPAFDYELLDDVLPGIDSPTNPLRSALIGCRPAAIGPLVEYAFLAERIGALLPPLDQVTSSELADALVRSLAHRWSTLPTKSSSMHSREAEFSRVPEVAGVSDPYWVAYVQRVRHAAAQAGFDAGTARKLAGSFAELADNLWQHSQSPSSGLVGYRREAGTFEFVIADAGIGVLASLNEKPEFARVTDAGTAIEIALSLADTPFGLRTGRGEGYRNMFANLVNMWGTLRVRSGDHGLLLEGLSPSLRSKTTFQAIDYKGFIVSLTCRA